MIYLDNSATTPLLPSLRNQLPKLAAQFANPSSLHIWGFEAEKAVDAARLHVAAALGCQKEEVFFTSGGTEGDNLAIFGAIEAKKRRGNTILTTDSEHPAVSQVLKKAKEMGFKVIRIRTKGGELDLEQLSSAATPDVILTTMMLVNNETGAVYDIPAASKIIRKQCPDALIHTDAVQGFLKLPFSPRELHVDLLTVSAHKIHGLKGSGALYVKKGTRILPHMLGGGQEKGLRSGTENTLGIAVFGLACEEGKKNLSSHIRHMASLRQWLLLQLRDIPGVHLNLPSNPVCHILHFSLPGHKSEVVLHTLSREDIAVSSGSACSSKKGKSPVLEAFGLTPERADSAIRVSLSVLNTQQDIQTLVEKIKNIL